jgi:hypothetical protein
MADDIELVKGKHAEPTADQALWLVIRKATECISYNHDENFIDMVLCPEQQYHNSDDEGLTRQSVPAMRARRSLPNLDVEAYRLLKAATEAFVMTKCGANIERSHLPFPP